ncbi:MAG: DUF819 family protein [Planctomycetota bacterium]|nr:DUF819 family protein [Planctomycetota bacterium]
MTPARAAARLRPPADSRVTSDPIYILAVLAAFVALSEWLVRRTVLRHLGTALLVIVITAVAANLGAIPPYTDGVPLYDVLLSDGAYLAIFWLLLRVNLRDVLRAGRTIVVVFLAGSAGTVAGVLVAMRLVGGKETFGDLQNALGGMFVGTYTGGSINFNAVAVHYGVVQDGLLYAGATAVDAGMTTVWMAATLILPRVLARFWPRPRSAAEVASAADGPLLGLEEDTETLHPIDLGCLLALGAACVFLSRRAAGWAADALGWDVPAILMLTTLALVLAQFRVVRELRGARCLGMFGIYLFLAVIGALCDLEALAGLGALGFSLVIFVFIVVGVHGVVAFGAAALLRAPPEVAAVASQANIGGGTSALALARSLGRGDLVLPAILIGALGNALGTYLGFATAEWFL